MTTNKQVMKKILSIILLISACLTSVHAQDSTATTQPEQTVQDAAAGAPAQRPDLQTEIAPGRTAQMADSAYAADNFSLAEQLYLESIKTDGTSTTLFYNLGNAYYRQGNLGKAIVNYERALKLDPTNADAQTNLEFVKSKITDRQIDEGSIMTTMWNTITGFFKADTWACIAIALFALFIASAFTYILSDVVLVKKLSFFGGIVVFMLCASAIIVSFAAANRATDNSHAIILPPSAQLSTIPREARTQAEEAFLLHEGTKVEVVDSVMTPGEGMWYEVKVGQNERAWIKATDVERI